MERHVSRPTARPWAACTVLVAGLACATAAVAADAPAATDAVAAPATATAIERPPRGMRMAQVESRFGAPATRQDAVGSPPITRWEYPGFIVFFEGEFVIHAVPR